VIAFSDQHLSTLSARSGERDPSVTKASDGRLRCASTGFVVSAFVPASPLASLAAPSASARGEGVF
jgi:hypothetical protein